MNPFVMTLMLVVAVALFAWQIQRRWRLMRLGPNENRFDQIGERLRRTWRFAFVQERMRRYWWAGIAHWGIFIGFVVLLFRSLVLFARGYSPEFTYWGIFDKTNAFGAAYSFIKDVFIILVILATLVFFYYRLVQRLKRMTLSFEGLLILLIIFTMMWADIFYEGARVAQHADGARKAAVFAGSEPTGSLMAMGLQGSSHATLKVLEHAGFWMHTGLVLLFLNLLPISKHFHVITAIPNVFLQNLGPRGRLPKIDDIEGKIEREETLGLARIDQLSWKGVLDLYTCTECGRCTDRCPANQTGKLLSPKHLTLDLRDHLYHNEKKLTAPRDGQPAASGEGGNGKPVSVAAPVVPDPIKPECCGPA